MVIKSTVKSKKLQRKKYLYNFLSSSRISSLIIPNGPSQESNWFDDDVNELLPVTVKRSHTDTSLAQGPGEQ